MDNPGKNIVNKIKDEHIVPESHFALNWKNYLFWIIWGMMLIFGALFFSLIILNFLDIEPRIFHYFGLQKFMFMLMRTAPFLWIGLSLLALISGLLAFRKTKRGYRYSLLFVTSLGVLIVSVLGITLHMAKINDRLGKGFLEGSPGYRRVAFPMEERWSRPDEKMLGGEIMKVYDGQIMLISFGDEIWEVYYSPDTEIRIREKKMIPGIKIGVIGEKIGEKKFQASFIRSFPRQYHLMKRPVEKLPYENPRLP